jgi:hypothetical protein
LENTTKEVYGPETLSPGLGIVPRFLKTNFRKAGQLDWKTHKSELITRTKRHKGNFHTST